MNNSRSETFAEQLRRLREEAGYSSLAAAIEAMNSKSDNGKAISKSMLSLLERGDVQTIKPDTLQMIAQTYGAPYEPLAQKWFAERYNVKLTNSGDSFLKHADPEECVLEGPKGSEIEDFKIISTNELCKQQERLPTESQVGVSALSFIDDNVLFFEMVARNLLRGIAYYYLMPEEEHVAYKTFLTRVTEKYPKLTGKLDGSLTHFIPRPPNDRVANYVVHVIPGGELAGYVGLLGVNRPQYFQIAGRHLTWRLFESFCWSLTVVEDPAVSKGLSELNWSISKSGALHIGTSLASLVKKHADS